MSVGTASLAGPTSRLLLIGYGQSNMNVFFSQDGSLETPAGPSPPVAAANTFFYDGTSVTTVPGANGIRTLQNTLTNITGHPTISLDGAVGGSALTNLLKGNAGYSALINQILAVLRPTDQCFVLFDQGEGDADGSPHPDQNTYMANINLLHGQIVGDIGRTKANCPFILCAKGSAFVADGSLGGGTTNGSWHTIQNAQTICTQQYPLVLFSHSEIDFNRLDGYHYDGASLAKGGVRFAQSIIAWLALSNQYPNWSISGAATVDTTHTNVNLAPVFGTDFTPASSGIGWEVSGDNGVTWSAGTQARVNSAQLQLTHASLSTTSTRLIRYMYGFGPNDTGLSCPSSGSKTLCTGPSLPILDNSSMALPLSPTTWDIRPIPLSTLPVPTWRYGVALTGSSSSQTATAIPLGPSISAQKFLIFSLVGPGLAGTITATPTDNLGNAVGTPITTSQIVMGSVCQIVAGGLGADANSAALVNLTMNCSANPFSGTIMNLWTVPTATMNSTAAVGTASVTLSSATAIATTIAVSSGGFIVQAGHNSNNYATAAALTGSQGFGTRREQGSGIPTYAADAANCTGTATSSMTATYPSSGNLEIVAASWF